MSTPTPPYQIQHPTSASKKTLQQQHNQPSPAPRSVPSPATLRKDHAARTPSGHVSTGLVHAARSGLVGGSSSTPMARRMSREGGANGSTNSPGGFNVLGIGTPTSSFVGGQGVGLGVNLGTPLMDIATPAIGAAMDLSMSDLGISMAAGVEGLAHGVGRRDEDEERRLKMSRVLHRVGKARGRVSEEGIMRLSRKVGFEIEFSLRDREKDAGSRTITISGKVLVIDVTLANHVVQRSTVTFAADNEEITKQSEEASIVLLHDLAQSAGKGASNMEAKLNSFASNLEHLARLDRLSERIDCFEAIAGVYASLRRLYESELTATGAVAEHGGSTRMLEAELLVACKRSGRPTTNAHGKLGVAIEYWYRGRSDLRANRVMLGNEKMDRIGQREAEQSNAQGDELDRFEIRIEIEASLASSYPPVRVSKNWLPDSLVVQTNPASDSSLRSDVEIPWQEPSITYLVADESGAMDAKQSSERMSVDKVGGRPPDLRFVARLEPPVVMPWHVANQLLLRVNASPPTANVRTPYHHLLLGSNEMWLDGETVNLKSTDDIERNLVRLVARGGGTEKEERNMDFVPSTTKSSSQGVVEEVLHQYHLSVTKLDLGYRMERIPFSHPRQLVDILPVLRQWALTGIILRSVFTIPHALQPVRRTGPGLVPIAEHPPVIPSPRLDSFIQNSESRSAVATSYQQACPPIDIAVSLTTSADPAIFISTSAVGELNVSILSSGEIVVEEGVDIAKGSKNTSRAVKTEHQSNLRHDRTSGEDESVPLKQEEDLSKHVASPKTDEKGKHSAHDKGVSVGARAKQERVSRLAKGLEAVGGNLGIWLEWIRSEVTR